MTHGTKRRDAKLVPRILHNSMDIACMFNMQLQHVAPGYGHHPETTLDKCNVSQPGVFGTFGSMR